MAIRIFKYWLILCLQLTFKESEGQSRGVPRCVAPSCNYCFEDDLIGGSLSLDCSGSNFMVTFETDHPIGSLSIFANCSSPCEVSKGIYYYDTTHLAFTQLRAMNTTINGTSGLGMPPTLGSTCTVFGCYYSRHLGGIKRFTADSCSQAQLPVITHLLNEVPSSSAESSPTNQTTTISDSYGKHDISSTETSGSSVSSTAAQSSNSTLMTVVPVLAVMIIVVGIVTFLLGLGLYHYYQRHHKSGSNTTWLHNREDIVQSTNNNGMVRVENPQMRHGGQCNKSLCETEEEILVTFT